MGLEKREKWFVYICGCLIGFALAGFFLRLKKDEEFAKAGQRPQIISKKPLFIENAQEIDRREFLVIDLNQVVRYRLLGVDWIHPNLIEEVYYARKADDPNLEPQMVSRAYYLPNRLWLYSQQKIERLPDGISLIYEASPQNYFLVEWEDKTLEGYFSKLEYFDSVSNCIRIGPDYRFTEIVERPPK